MGMCKGQCLTNFGGVGGWFFILCFQNKFPSFEVHLWLMLKLLKVLQLAQAKKPRSY